MLHVNKRFVPKKLQKINLLKTTINCKQIQELLYICDARNACNGNLKQLFNSKQSTNKVQFTMVSLFSRWESSALAAVINCVSAFYFLNHRVKTSKGKSSKDYNKVVDQLLISSSRSSTLCENEQVYNCCQTPSKNLRALVRAYRYAQENAIVCSRLKR